MPISPKDTKILWANAAGRCAFSDCRTKLCTDHTHIGEQYTLGDMAHIKGENPGSNRYDANQSEGERDSYSNRILLCTHHHRLIDQKTNEYIYTTAVLHDVKNNHEQTVSGQTELAQFRSRDELAFALRPLLAENYQVFINFGPQSEIARKNPHSDAHSIWQLERLSTIVPNNRRMLTFIDSNGELFAPDEQKVVAAFRIHVRSYERWVKDKISYECVVRFPVEFEHLIERINNAGT